MEMDIGDLTNIVQALEDRVERDAIRANIIIAQHKEKVSQLEMKIEGLTLQNVEHKNTIESHKSTIEQLEARIKLLSTREGEEINHSHERAPAETQGILLK
jgi:predicted RNase H-like nuclease (RuvC/YqgF family)